MMILMGFTVYYIIPYRYLFMKGLNNNYIVLYFKIYHYFF